MGGLPAVQGSSATLSSLVLLAQFGLREQLPSDLLVQRLSAGGLLRLDFQACRMCSEVVDRLTDPLVLGTIKQPCDGAKRKNEAQKQ